MAKAGVNVDVQTRDDVQSGALYGGDINTGNFNFSPNKPNTIIWIAVIVVGALLLLPKLRGK